MRITRLQIERFRSIKSLDFQVPQACALVGPNNAGKSNILEAIKRVLLADYGPRTSTFSEEDVHQRNEDDNIEICLTFGPAFEYRKIQKADPVSIERLRFCWSRYQRGEKKGLRRLEQECLKPDGEVPTVQTSYGKPGHVLDPHVSQHVHEGTANAGRVHRQRPTISNGRALRQGCGVTRDLDVTGVQYPIRVNDRALPFL